MIKDLVRAFLENPADATRYLAPAVRVHQVSASRTVTFERTAAWFAAHTRAATVHELLADGDRVFARWSQDGEVVTLASGVYRIADHRIAECWEQTDKQLPGEPAMPVIAPRRIELRSAITTFAQVEVALTLGSLDDLQRLLRHGWGFLHGDPTVDPAPYDRSLRTLAVNTRPGELVRIHASDDDLLIFGDRDHLESLAGELDGVAALSSPRHGLDVLYHPDHWFLDQRTFAAVFYLLT